MDVLGTSNKASEGASKRETEELFRFNGRTIVERKVKSKRRKS